jgi:magnesium transporter
MDRIVINPDELQSPPELALRITNERAADIVEALNQVQPETAAAVLLHLPADRAVEVLDQPGLNDASQIVSRLPVERAVPLLRAMSSDQLADVFRQLKEPVRAQLMQRAWMGKHGICLGASCPTRNTVPVVS